MSKDICGDLCEKGAICSESGACICSKEPVSILRRLYLELDLYCINIKYPLFFELLTTILTYTLYISIEVQTFCLRFRERLLSVVNSLIVPIGIMLIRKNVKPCAMLLEKMIIESAGRLQLETTALVMIRYP